MGLWRFALPLAHLLSTKCSGPRQPLERNQGLPKAMECVAVPVRMSKARFTGSSEAYLTVRVCRW